MKKFVTISALACFLLTTPVFAIDINVSLDQAKLVRLPEDVSTVVIGNPAIADASVEANNLLVLTAKGFGTTNMIILDIDGEVISEHQVNVINQSENIVTVQRGVNRTSYSCIGSCQPTVSVGDDQEYFSTIQGQINARNEQSNPQ